MEKKEALKQAEVDERVEEVDKIIALIEERLADEDVQMSVADLMRLLELRRELARSQSGSMTVGWIDECQQTPEE